MKLPLALTVGEKVKKLLTLEWGTYRKIFVL